MRKRPPMVAAVAVALAVLAGGCALDLFATEEGQELDAAASSLVPEGTDVSGRFIGGDEMFESATPTWVELELEPGGTPWRARIRSFKDTAAAAGWRYTSEYEVDGVVLLEFERGALDGHVDVRSARSLEVCKEAIPISCPAEVRDSVRVYSR
jgi:hypothetical protein